MRGLFRQDDPTFLRLRNQAEGRAARQRDGTSLTATLFGVSTILLDDGKTRLLIDGFFSRPSLLSLGLGRLRPNRRRIARALSFGGAANVAGVFVSHSHYDHAMDAPTVASITGATVYGS